MRMNDSMSNPTRRDFLVASGAVATAAAIGWGATAASKSSASAQEASAASDAADASADSQSQVVSGAPSSEDPEETIIEYPTKDLGGDTSYQPLLTEVPTLVMSAPDTTEYESDVLVVGGGLAALNAAWEARQSGLSVVLVDKGTPGYSGLSSWASCDSYYDPELDADRDLWEQYMLYSCDHFANLDWEDVWLDESKETFARLQEWGWITSYPNGNDAGYWVDGQWNHDDVKGYFRKYSDQDRRKVFMNVLNENEVTVVDHTMVTDIVQDDAGACVGAVGVHFKSGTPITFHAKSVILCTGTGATKSTGFPVGADTFDGLIMGYEHGLPVTGLEFEDFHGTSSWAAGNVMAWTSWQYVEPVWPTGGTVDESTLTKTKDNRTLNNINGFRNGYAPSDWSANILSDDGAACSVASKNGNEDDPRKGKFTSGLPRTDRPGGAPGMPAHLGAGIWCGLDDTTGTTAIPGLYVAGDGTNGCYVGGPCYGCQRGSTSNFVSIQGKRAADAAAEYVSSAGEISYPQDKFDEAVTQAMEPLNRETGFDPSYVRDILHSIIATGWVLISKSEESLNAALAQVTQLRNMTSGKLLAKNPHELRLCHEVEHQMEAMVIKLHASLERRESRGYHYRSDYPFKDDENFECYLTFTKGDDGEPVMEKVELKDRWKGDMSASYFDRYKLETPEELEKYGDQLPQ
jgi:succinate dehydrogenase/fumarate reductase flavoprotein subunit